MFIATMLGMIAALCLILILGVNTVDYYTSITYNTDRGRSPSIWNNARILDYIEDPGKGVYIGSDFVQVPTTPSTSGATFLGGFGDFAVFLSQGGTIASSTAGIIGGEIVTSSDGDDEGVALVSTCGSIMIAPKTGSGHRKVWFEARVKVSTISDTKSDCFWGLMEGVTPSATVPITATAGTMADKNFIGFQRNATDGDQIDFTYKADGQTVQVPTGLSDIITVANSGTLGLVADTYVKLGFKYDRDELPDKRITIFVNGMALTTYITETMISAATFPSDVALGLCDAILNATGSSPGSKTDDWIWAAAEFAS